MKIKKKVLSILLTLMLCVSAMPVGIINAEPVEAATYQKLKITWFDVGAGDSMYMRLPNGKNVLIDGGLSSKGATVVSKLKKMNVKTIHYLISTHPDADHVGGLQSVFKELKVLNFYYPGDVKYDTTTAKNVMSLAKKEGCNLIKPKRGRTLLGGNGCKLEFVQSSKDYTSNNQDSLALFIDYGPLEVLVCGDNEKGSQLAIEKHNVDILQLSHHGSKYATTTDFIKRFDPERVVVSTDGKKYGHPNVESFKRLKNYDSNIKVWRTDKKGDIIVTASSSSWKFEKTGVLVGKYCIDTTSTPTDNTIIYVYVTKTGTKYHKIKSCSGLSNASTIYKKTLSEAKSNGLTPCKICN